MTFVVTEACIRCKYTDCVDVCPVDAFREGPNFLVIDPDECIDCAVCVPECPVNAIYAEEDVPAGQRAFTSRPGCHRFSSPSLCSILLQASASGSASLVFVMGFHSRDSSAFSGVKCCWSVGTSSSA